jgi:hypothetical protein
VLTLHGRVSFSRYVLRPQTEQDKEALKELEGRTAVVPLDEYLGIGRLPFKMSVNMMLEIAYWAQSLCSYDEAEEAVRKARGAEVGDDTIRAVANKVGEIVFGNDCRRAAASYAELVRGSAAFPDKKKPGTLYIEVDGAALNTRQKDNDGSTWRENKLGLVFCTDNVHFWTDKNGERQHKIMKREYVSYVGSAASFQEHIYDCALRNGYGTYERTVLLSDGATWIRNMKEAVFPDAQQILDLYHLCENVSNFAKSLYFMDEKKYKPWSDEVCGMLKEGKTQEALLAVGKCGRAPSGFNLYGYIENNLSNIDYPSYRSQGLFVGSGAIESGNKIVLQKRLKQSGMRWNPKTAQYMLTLRAKQLSGLWNEEVALPVARFYSS